MFDPSVPVFPYTETAQKVRALFRKIVSCLYKTYVLGISAVT